MTSKKKPSPAKQKRSLLRLKCFNEMVKRAVYLNTHYPGLDIRPVRNYFGGGGSYDVVWFHNYDQDNCVHLAVLEEDIPLSKLVKPVQTVSFYENFRKFKEMFESFECTDDYWKSLMRDVIHNMEKKVCCGDACDNVPLCSTIYNVINTWSRDKG